MSNVKITNVRAIATAPRPGCNWVVVRMDTNQPGLYGLGCATFTQRYRAVVETIDAYMAPLLVGQDALDVKDQYYRMVNASYWRGGPVLNNAVSGCDMALWDILAKEAGMPLYQLLGGRQRTGIRLYRHVRGSTCEEMEDCARALMEEGYTNLRFSMLQHDRARPDLPENSKEGAHYDSEKLMRLIPSILEHMRLNLGEEVGLIWDAHERFSPAQAKQLLRAAEPYRLMFMEDVLAPEQAAWYPQVRAASAVPLAAGELFHHTLDWQALVEQRMIDYIRCHLSQIGGITPALQLASLCEHFDIRTAWHGPWDVSPVGHAAQLHLDYAIHNFGIQEWPGLEEADAVREVFTGLPEIRAGIAYLSDAPGLGIDINEGAALRYPCEDRQAKWLLARADDGTVHRA